MVRIYKEHTILMNTLMYVDNMCILCIYHLTSVKLGQNGHVMLHL